MHCASQGIGPHQNKRPQPATTGHTVLRFVDLPESATQHPDRPGTARARATPSYAHAPRRGYAVLHRAPCRSASAVAGLRRRRAAFALAGGRGKPRAAQHNRVLRAGVRSQETCSRARQRAARRIRAGSRCTQQTVMSCAPAACRTQRALMKRRAPCVLRARVSAAT